MEPVVLLTATGFEQEKLAEELQESVLQTVAGRRWLAGALSGRQVLLVEGGLGAVNTAHALSCVLQELRPSWVLHFGVGGAYLETGLSVGDVALANEEVYGDVGVHTSAGWQGAETIGIPLWRRGREYYNRFELDAEIVAKTAEVLASSSWSQGGAKVVTGPFVTVQEVSGTEALGRQRQARFNAICENMEGAAAAHLCLIYGVPMIEVRAISNLVEDRRREAWNMPLAVRRAQAAALALVAALEI